ncbi:fibronectin type III domain-containing protein, partial [Bradyrhizobium sp. NBAIM08]|uniref:fibronectin type III domain-containing protein n=1 Tax=Bradyrhizobium sp. NBAIM08 TaxID=2793815 RepID=UPI001CD5E848
MVRRRVPSYVLRVVFASCLLLLLQAGQAVAGNVRLTWDPNLDDDTVGYVLVYGTSSRVYTKSVTLPAAATTHEVTGLPDGAHYFALRAFDLNGVQSGNSNE